MLRKLRDSGLIFSKQEVFLSRNSVKLRLSLLNRSAKIAERSKNLDSTKVMLSKIRFGTFFQSVGILLHKQLFLFLLHSRRCIAQLQRKLSFQAEFSKKKSEFQS